jgi:hypothetical protein
MATAAGAAALLTLAGATTAIAGLGPARGADTPGVVLRIGDRVEVDGQPIGCRVARQDGAVVLDCRRAGALAGTYGTMLSSRKAMAVRFTSNESAKVVFTGTHRGKARRCR